MTGEERKRTGRQLAQKGLVVHRGLETGVPDPDEAVRWYERSVKMGYVPAMNSLGVVHLERKAYEAAYFWFQEAALAGDAESLYRLGTLYFRGEYVRQDLEKACGYFAEAYGKGVREACFYLGYYAEHGLLAAPDCGQAAAYYREGVSSGCAACAAALGRCFRLGRGVPRDEEKSCAYERLARRWGGGEIPELKAEKEGHADAG